MCPRAGLDRCGKSRLPPGFDPRTVQPVASRYTDYDTRPTLLSRVAIFLHWAQKCYKTALWGQLHQIRCRCKRDLERVFVWPLRNFLTYLFRRYDMKIV